VSPPVSIALAIGSFALTLMSVATLSLLFGWLVGMGPVDRSQAWQSSEWQRLRPQSELRGQQLLKEWLSPAQLKSFESFRYFDVVGCDSATVYRIHYGTQANVEQLDQHGRPFCRWCFTPVGALIAGDVMLAQKIALEAYESAALAVANRFSINEPAVPSLAAGSGCWWTSRLG
jgi:hypothetical protein